MGEKLSLLAKVSEKKCRGIFTRVIKQFGDKEISSEVSSIVRRGGIENSVLFNLLANGLGPEKQHVSRYQADKYDYKPRNGRQF